MLFSGCTRRHQTVSGLYLAVSRLYQTVPGCTGLYRAVPDCTGLYRAVPGWTGLYRAVPGWTGLYHGCTGLFLTVSGLDLSVSGLYRSVPGSTRAEPNSTKYRWYSTSGTVQACSITSGTVQACSSTSGTRFKTPLGLVLNTATHAQCWAEQEKSVSTKKLLANNVSEQPMKNQIRDFQ